jgi:CRP-like cAMP-binding protein
MKRLSGSEALLQPWQTLTVFGANRDAARQWPESRHGNLGEAHSAQKGIRTSGHSAHEQRFERGSTIVLPEEAVGEVLEGIVALYAAHADGAEALTALLASGDFHLPHPPDDCHLSAIAHTDVRIAVRRRSDSVREPSFAVNLQSRLLRAEAWAAMQAHPFVEQRLMSFLRLTGEQFGVPDGRGTLIEVRLTHSLLASAIGATRATVTRVITTLATREELLVLDTPAGRRYWLPASTRGVYSAV